MHIASALLLFFVVLDVALFPAVTREQKDLAALRDLPENIKRIAHASNTMGHGSSPLSSISHSARRSAR